MHYHCLAMGDDFGTVNVRRGDRAREIEVLRQRYRAHRDALARMISDSPTEQLAGEYQRLIASIDDSLRKLDEIEGRPATQPGSRPLPPPVTPPAPPVQSMTSPGARPLSPEPVTEPQRYVDEPAPAAAGGSRTLLILVVGVLVLGAIAYLIWRASRDRRPPSTSTTGSVVEQPVTPAQPDTIAPATAAPVTSSTAPAAAASAGALKITPTLADYGVVRKGTRAVRQFELVNGGAAPVAYDLSRSSCRCLFYAFHSPVAAHGKETVTVTVDGAKAKAGTVDEQVTVTEKKGPATYGTIGIRAVVK
jgi:hypothetical protein